MRYSLTVTGPPLYRAHGLTASTRCGTTSLPLLTDGVDIKAVSEYLGHHSAAFTLATYCHLMPSAPDRMRAAVDRALTETGGAPDVREHRG